MRYFCRTCIAATAVLGLWAGAVFAQQNKAEGVVQNINTRQEISNVNIYIKGLNIGTTSDHLGKFRLLVRGNPAELTVVFQHIGFETREIRLSALQKIKHIYLQPRVIPLRTVEIQGESITRPEIEKDLPQAIEIVDAKNFEIRGFVDAGDLLRTDQSVQVEEELSGKKTVAIRGGNADEVLVMYNGVKLNNVYDNIFDLSLIDLEDIQRFEIIKGSNTALYGPDAFSGVINIVPKTRLDYSLRFQQRLGTYRSGNWGVHVNPKNLLWHSDKLQTSYSFKRGGLKRNFIDNRGEDGLENTSTHHTAILNYTFLDGADEHEGRAVAAMYINTALDYANRRDNESLVNKNQLFSLKYSADLSRFQNYNLAVSYKNLAESQVISTATGFLDRDIDDRSLFINAENTVEMGDLSWLIAYQYQNAELDYFDDRAGPNLTQGGLKSATLRRQHHGFVSIIKLHNEPQSDFLQALDLDLSARHDIVTDTQKDAQFRVPAAGTSTPADAGEFGENDWRESLVKFSIKLAGGTNDFDVKSYLTFGKNSKFPTLFQQISSATDAATIVRFGAGTTLLPEKNNSFEIGASVKRQMHEHPAFYGWGISALYFQNHYDNKIVSFSSVTNPVANYFTVPDARISGFEFKPSLYMYKKKLTIELGFSKYAISDKQAFPFKSDLKRTLSVSIDHAGYAFQALWFKEGEQVGKLRQLDGTPVDVILPSYANLDIHLSKSFSISKIKLFLNLSGRNLLNAEDVVLEGIALRDRRYYITLGSQI